MTRIEDMLRQALAEAPPPDSTYPGSMIEQRVRRARRRVSIGATIAVAAVVAAIVVPLSTLGGGSPQRVAPAVHSPSPNPSSSVLSAPSGANAGVTWVSAAPGESPWALVNLNSSRCAGCTNSVLSRVGAAGLVGTRYPVKFPGVVVATPHLVWVVGGTEDETWVSALNVATGIVTNETFANQHLSAGSADGGDLYVADANNSRVIPLSLADNTIVQRGSITLRPKTNIGDMVTTAGHHIWVSDGTKLVELSPTSTGVRIADSVDWHGSDLWGPVNFGPANPSPGAPSVWSWDGRLIALTPSYLHEGTSVAEGYRVPLPSEPAYAVSTPDGGVFVGSTATARTDHPAVDYFSPRALRRDTPRPTGQIRTGQVTSMALDPAGGVDVTVGTSNGKLIRWHPAGS